ncbi:MAG: caspase family protein, partial [Desulfosarcinaceae bacterium]|nr:caspase family protein [Desulfosarcinaceae bacterium]
GPKQDLAVTYWEDSYGPKLNGQPLPLKRNESSRSLAIAPDGQRFVLGADWTLFAFDAGGERLWQEDVPGVVWAVNITADGRYAVAGHRDGTLRWHRMDNGDEVLALFPHPDGERWVLWTPNGYYQASAGGEDLIGWQVNRSGDQAADFFEIARFRDTYYRPDVIARVLETGDETKALALADQARGSKSATLKNASDILPPTMAILSPAPGTETTSNKLVLFYEAESTTGPVTEIVARVQGRPAMVRDHSFRDVKSDTSIRIGQITIEVPARDVTISLIARNQHGDSQPATYLTNWAGETDWFKPNLYVLSVGVSHYDLKNMNLKYAAQDARDFIAAIEKQKGGLYKEVKPRLLISDKNTKEATQDSILDGLEWIMRETTSRDVAMVFLSGHGTNDAKGNYNFLPQDGNPARLHRTGIDKHIFKKYLGDIPGKTVFFFDSCRSGNVRLDGIRNGQAPDTDKIANELADADSGVIVFSSSTGRQFSLEKDELQNGVFTEALVEGIEGQASYDGDWYVSITELEKYITDRVKELTDGEQKPVSAKPTAVEDLKIIKIPQ